MKRLLVVIFLLAGITARAEMRIWQDKQGNAIEAEFVAVSAGKVVLRSKDGKMLKINPEGLCAADQAFLKTSIPPKLEIIFSKKQNRHKGDYWSYAEVTMNGSVNIRKTNREEYSREMKAVLMMIGEDQRTRNYIMLDRAEGTFDFTKTKEFELSGQSFTMSEDNYDNSFGTDYVGFLAVVFGEDGAVLAVKSSRKDFEEHCEALTEFKSGNRFSKKFVKLDRNKRY